MKAYRCWLLLLISLCAPLLAGASGQPPPHRFVLPAAQAVTEGEPSLFALAPAPAAVIDVEVRVVGAANLGAFEFDFAYDSTQAQLTGITPTAFLGQASGCVPTNVRCVVALGPLTQGNLTRTGAYTYGKGDGANGDGVLAVLHFQSNSATSVPVQITRALLVDTAANPSIPLVNDTTLVVGDRLLLPLVRR